MSKQTAELPRDCSLQDVLDFIHDEKEKHATHGKVSRLLSRLGQSLRSLDNFGQGIDVLSQVSGISLLVWGSIRLLLRLFLNHVEILEKLCDTFVTIEEWLGRFAVYRRIFNTSDRVRAGLELITQDIVDLGNETIRFYRSHPIRSVFTASWNTKMDQLVKKIHRHKDLIEDDAKALAISEGVAAQAEEQKRQSELKQRAIRRWLSPTNFEPDFFSDSFQQSLAQKVGGTCDWFCYSDRFQNWLRSSNRVFWIHGKPGCGKTTLSSAIVEKITADVEVSSQVKIGYFQFRTDDNEKIDSLGLLKSLILQLVSSEDLVSLLDSTYDRCVHDRATSHSLCPSLRSALKVVISKLSEFHLVIDGMDECQDKTSCIRSLLDALDCPIEEQSSQTKLKVKLIIVSRMNHQIAQALDNLEVTSYQICSEDTEKDMVLYLSNAVASSPRLKRLSEDMKEDIRGRLAAGAGGMFLWARFMIDDLEKQRSRSAVERCLARLPKGLPETYQRILSALDPDDSDTARIFCAMTAARRPLREQELIAVLEIDPDVEHYVEARRIDGPLGDWLYGSCGPIVEIHKGVVQFIHSTTREYLLNEAEFPYRVDPRDAHEFMATISLTYLLFNHDPNNGEPLSMLNSEAISHGSVSRKEIHFLQYACLYWANHLTSCVTPLSKTLSNKFLSFFQKPHCLTWVEAVYRICDYPAASINKTVARLSTLATKVIDTQQDLAIAIRKWSQTLVNLIRDWDAVLMNDPATIHSIPVEWFPTSNLFRKLLKAESQGSIFPLGSESLPSWNRTHISGLRAVNYIDILEPSLKRNFLICRPENRYSVTLLCRSNETSLPLGEIVFEEGKASKSAHLETFVFSNDNRYLACILRRSWDDLDHYVFKVYVVDLQSSKLHGRILAPVKWLDSVLLETFKVPRHSYSWCLEVAMEMDLLNPGIAFSADSQYLYTPSSTWDVATGAKQKGLFDPTIYRAVMFSNNGKYAATLDAEGFLKIWDISSGGSESLELRSTIQFRPHIPKLTSLSSTGRFVALWLFKPMVGWTSEKLLPRWFTSVDLAVFDSCTGHTSILCRVKDTYRISPFTGEFSEDESNIAVAVRKGRPLIGHLSSLSIRNELVHEQSIANRILVFSAEKTNSIEVQWVPLATIPLPSNTDSYIHPPSFRFDAVKAKIGMMIAGQFWSIGLTHGPHVEVSLELPETKSSSHMTRGDVCGVAISQDLRKVVILSQTVTYPTMTSTRESTIDVDGQWVSARALFGYLEDRKHEFASRTELVERLNEVFIRQRHGSASSKANLDEVAAIVSQVPQMAHKVVIAVAKGDFTVQDTGVARESGASNGSNLRTKLGEENDVLPHNLRLQVFETQPHIRELQSINDFRVTCTPWSLSKFSLRQMPKFSLFADQTATTLFTSGEVLHLDTKYGLSQKIGFDPLDAYVSTFNGIDFNSISRSSPQLSDDQSIGRCFSGTYGGKMQCDHQKPHPNGRHLGYVVTEQNVEGTSARFCLCIFDVVVSKIVWMWHSRCEALGGFEAPSHPIEFTFHPTETIISWALEGASAAVCDFTSKEPPHFLDVHARHNFTDTTLCFSPSGKWLVILSRVDRVSPEAEHAFFKSNATTIDSYVSLVGWVNFSSTRSARPDQHLLELSIFDLSSGAKTVTTLTSKSRSNTLRVTDDELQLTGVSPRKGRILLYKFNLLSIEQWYQQEVSALPTHITNDPSINARRMCDNDQSYVILLGYWPYPNNWPHPDLGGKPIPQPVLIEIPFARCKDWTPIASRTVSHSRGSTVKNVRECRFDDSSAEMVKEYPSSSAQSALKMRSTELAIFVHEIHAGNERLMDLTSWRELEANLPGHVDVPRPIRYHIAEACRVCHSFPWVTSSHVGGSMSPCASGTAEGYRYESIRARVQSIAEGTAKDLYEPWWYWDE